MTCSPKKSALLYNIIDVSGVPHGFIQQQRTENKTNSC